MSEVKPETMCENLEGNMNHMLRALREGRLEQAHFQDMVKLWGLLYKKAVLIDTMEKVSRNGKLLHEESNHTTIVLTLSMLTAKVIKDMLKESDRFNLMLEGLIQKEEKVG